MSSIEVKNVSTFEPDVGAGKLLARGETAKVEDTETIRALIDDGHLREVVKPLTPAQQKKADEEAARAAAEAQDAAAAADGDTTPDDGENGGTE